MSMVCPQCGNAYEQRLQCQVCGVRLLYQDQRRVRGRTVGPAPRWRQTPWGRILIGLFLAQGLFYGLRHLLTGALLALQGDAGPQETWGTPAGLILLQCLRLGTLLLGAVLAGGGQRRGLLLGAIVGVWNGVLSVLLQPGPARAMVPLELLGQPLLQTALGALGGWLGCAFWKPLPVADPAAARPNRPRLALRRLPSFGGRIAWFRVTAGVALAVAGTLSAGALFDLTLDASHGKLSTTDEMQDRVVTWEIKALALLLGGALAGSTTRNGLKQGLAVGVLSSAILVGIEFQHARQVAQVAALTLTSSLTLALAGGWFGSQLFPPVVKARRTRCLGPT
jgi:hypothetical protein